MFYNEKDLNVSVSHIFWPTSHKTQTEVTFWKFKMENIKMETNLFWTGNLRPNSRVIDWTIKKKV